MIFMIGYGKEMESIIDFYAKYQICVKKKTGRKKNEEFIWEHKLFCVQT